MADIHTSTSTSNSALSSASSSTSSSASPSAFLSSSSTLHIAGAVVGRSILLDGGLQNQNQNSSKGYMYKPLSLTLSRETASDGLSLIQATEEARLASSASNIDLGTPFFAEDILVCVRITQLATSLFVERPKRREFLALNLFDIFFQYSFTSNRISSFDLRLSRIQMDNYSESAIYPVLLHSVSPSSSSERQSDREREKDSGERDSAFHLVVIQDEELTTKAQRPHFRYIALRVFELAVSIDSATIQILATDLINDVQVVSKEQTLCDKNPERWIHEYTSLILSPGHRQFRLDIEAARGVETKVYYENITIHPIAILATYVKSTYPRQTGNDRDGGKELAILSYIPSFASVVRFPIKLSSFIVEDAFESAESIASRLLIKVAYEIPVHLASLAGNLAVIGRPLGFARNIGGGVKALIYEPLEGAMLGPSSFVIGLGKGATGLVSGVVSGALDSTAALVGSYSSGLSKGLTTISGSVDRQLHEGRNELRKAMVEASRKGVGYGLLNAGGNVAHGIAAGVTGLVTRPIQEARQHGAVGFIKGVGFGVLGLAVKPVLGVTDGLTSAAHAISYTVGDYHMAAILRKPRLVDEDRGNIIPIISLIEHGTDSGPTPANESENDATFTVA